MNNLRYVCIFLIGISGIASAADWKLIDASKDKLMYIDNDSVRDRYDYKQIWVKTNFVVKQEGGYRSSKARLRIRCEDESFAIDYFIFYSETDGGGDSIGSSSDPYPKYDPIAPETVGAKIHDILCNANSESVPPG